MKIPNVKEMQAIRDNAKADSKVQDLLKTIVAEITYAAKRGESSVIMDGARYVIEEDNIPLRLSCNHLIDEGYSVVDYNGTETEETCFGTGYVAVRGIKVSW